MTRMRLEDLPPAMREQARAQLAGAPVVPREPPAPSKYGNQVVELEGERFDSKWELRRYQELLEQQAAGLIRELRHHVAFGLHVRSPAGDQVRIASYEADFTYRRGETLVVEDTKSEPTRRKESYRLKAAHFEAEYGVHVQDVVRVRRKRRDREVISG